MVYLNDHQRWSFFAYERRLVGVLKIVEDIKKSVVQSISAAGTTDLARHLISLSIRVFHAADNLSITATQVVNRRGRGVPGVEP